MKAFKIIAAILMVSVAAMAVTVVVPLFVHERSMKEMISERDDYGKLWGKVDSYLVDYHLEKMRLSKAMGKEEEAAKHKEEARKWIDKTGYERRRKELEEE